MAEKIAAGHLNADHMGWEAKLPGLLRFEDGKPVWDMTWAPITLISHTKRGGTVVRRFPDGHSDHHLKPTDQLLVRPSKEKS